jgi:hypothetical protein
MKYGQTDPVWETQEMGVGLRWRTISKYVARDCAKNISTVSS